jgi:hypothetical protein
VNLISVLNLGRLTGPLLMASPAPCVINVASRSPILARAGNRRTTSSVQARDEIGAVPYSCDVSRRRLIGGRLRFRINVLPSRDDVEFS